MQGAGIKLVIFDTWPTDPNGFGWRYLIQTWADRLRNPRLRAMSEVVPPERIWDFIGESSIREMRCVRRRSANSFSQPYSIPDHGLFIADIINDIAPRAEISVYRVLNDYGASDLDTLARAVEHAIATADGKPVVFNFSLGFGPEPVGLDLLLKEPTVAYRNSPAWAEHIGRAIHAGRILSLEHGARAHPAVKTIVHVFGFESLTNVFAVAAAGNDSSEELGQAGPRMPAIVEGVLGVSAIAGEREGVPIASSFSNIDDIFPQMDDGVGAFGGEVDVEAELTEEGPVGLFISDELPPGTPGGNRRGWAKWAGTSFAAPIAAAFAACVWSEAPDLPANSPVQSAAGDPSPDLMRYVVQNPDGSERTHIPLFQRRW